MLPPIPQGLVPVTVQQDPVRQKPDIPPVTPPQEGSQTGDLSLKKRDENEVRERMQEEQKRRQRERREAQQEEGNLDEKELKESPEKRDGIPRRGLWVDVKV